MTLPNEGGARVRFPPPLVFLGAIVLGVIVQRMAVPLSLLLAPRLRLMAGVLSQLRAAFRILHAASLRACLPIAAVLIPSAHELRHQLDKPRTVVAVGAAVLAVFCVLAVGNGAPVSFIYFRF